MSDIEKIDAGSVNGVMAQDEAELARMGYKQELKYVQPLCHLVEY